MRRGRWKCEVTLQEAVVLRHIAYATMHQRASVSDELRGTGEWAVMNDVLVEKGLIDWHWRSRVNALTNRCATRPLVFLSRAGHRQLKAAFLAKLIDARAVDGSRGDIASDWEREKKRAAEAAERRKAVEQARAKVNEAGEREERARAYEVATVNGRSLDSAAAIVGLRRAAGETDSELRERVGSRMRMPGYGTRVEDAAVQQVRYYNSIGAVERDFGNNSVEYRAALQAFAARPQRVAIARPVRLPTQRWGPEIAEELARDERRRLDARTAPAAPQLAGHRIDSIVVDEAPGLARALAGVDLASGPDSAVWVRQDAEGTVVDATNRWQTAGPEQVLADMSNMMTQIRNAGSAPVRVNAGEYGIPEEFIAPGETRTFNAALPRFNFVRGRCLPVAHQTEVHRLRLYCDPEEQRAEARRFTMYGDIAPGVPAARFPLGFPFISIDDL